MSKEESPSISKSDGTGQIDILPEVKKLAIAWIENYVPHGSAMPEIAQKWKLAEDIQRIVDQQSKEVRDKAIQDIQSEVYRRIEIHTGIEVIRKVDFDIVIEKLKG